MTHVVFSHTTLLKYEPIEVLMSGVDQSKVYKTTGSQAIITENGIVVIIMLKRRLII